MIRLIEYYSTKIIQKNAEMALDVFCIFTWGVPSFLAFRLAGNHRQAYRGVSLA